MSLEARSCAVTICKALINSDASSSASDVERFGKYRLLLDAYKQSSPEDQAASYAKSPALRALLLIQSKINAVFADQQQQQLQNLKDAATAAGKGTAAAKQQKKRGRALEESSDSSSLAALTATEAFIRECRASVKFHSLPRPGTEAFFGVVDANGTDSSSSVSSGESCRVNRSQVGGGIPFCAATRRRQRQDDDNADDAGDEDEDEEDSISLPPTQDGNVTAMIAAQRDKTKRMQQLSSHMFSLDLPVVDGVTFVSNVATAAHLMSSCPASLSLGSFGSDNSAAVMGATAKTSRKGQKKKSASGKASATFLESLLQRSDDHGRNSSSGDDSDGNRSGDASSSDDDENSIELQPETSYAIVRCAVEMLLGLIRRCQCYSQCAVDVQRHLLAVTSSSAAAAENKQISMQPSASVTSSRRSVGYIRRAIEQCRRRHEPTQRGDDVVDDAERCLDLSRMRTFAPSSSSSSTAVVNVGDANKPQLFGLLPVTRDVVKAAVDSMW